MLKVLLQANKLTNSLPRAFKMLNNGIESLYYSERAAIKAYLNLNTKQL